MKTIITTTLAGAMAFALPVSAQQATESVQPQVNLGASSSNAFLLNEISEKITAEPTTAAEVVKQAILQTKADAELVLQIVKVAVLAAPEQAEAIRKVALALAPDAEEDVEILIAGLLKGDQVAAATKFNAGDEPEGDEVEKNTVFDTNRGNLKQGKSKGNAGESGNKKYLTNTGGGSVFVMNNPLGSKVQNTNNSPNANHNQGANVNGGTTVVIRPPVTTLLNP